MTNSTYKPADMKARYESAQARKAHRHKFQQPDTIRIVLAGGKHYSVYYCACGAEKRVRA